MIANKIRYLRTFHVNGYTVNVENFSRPVTGNPTNKSYMKTVCDVYMKSVDGDKYSFSVRNMKSAINIIFSNFNASTNTFTMFNTEFSTDNVVIERNFRLYDIDVVK